MPGQSQLDGGTGVQCRYALLSRVVEALHKIVFARACGVRCLPNGVQFGGEPLFALRKSDDLRPRLLACRIELPSDVPFAACRDIPFAAEVRFAYLALSCELRGIRLPCRLEFLLVVFVPPDLRNAHRRKRRGRRPAQGKAVEDIRPGRKRFHQLGMCMRDVETIEPVETSEPISAPQQEALPARVRFDLGHWQRAFDNHHPGAHRRTGPAAQHVALESLDVDFQPVDFRRAEALEQERKRRAGHGDIVHRHARVYVPLRDGRIRGAEAGVREVVEREQSRARAHGALDDRFVRPVGAKPARIQGRWLDVQTPPAPFVKCPADRIDDGILRTDVDVAAVVDIAQRAPQADVLEILRVRNEHA